MEPPWFPNRIPCPSGHQLGPREGGAVPVCPEWMQWWAASMQACCYHLATVVFEYWFMDFWPSVLFYPAFLLLSSLSASLYCRCEFVSSWFCSLPVLFWRLYCYAVVFLLFFLSYSFPPSLASCYFQLCLISLPNYRASSVFQVLQFSFLLVSPPFWGSATCAVNATTERALKQSWWAEHQWVSLVCRDVITTLL